MNRLTGDIVLEIQTFLDHESFYNWIFACNVTVYDPFPRLDVNEVNSSLMKSGRPMIQKWLSKYVDFPIAKVQFGGAPWPRRPETPSWLERNADASTGPQTVSAAQWYGKRPNYFLDLMFDHLSQESEWEHGNCSSSKEANWFEKVIPNAYSPFENKWFETTKYYSYWPKLQLVTEQILTDAMIHGRHFILNGQCRFCLNQYFFLAALERQGCVQFPPHDRMFAIPSVLDRTCLDHDYQTDSMRSFTAKSTPDCNLANSFTVLDMLGGAFFDCQKSYWGDQVPRWEFVPDKSSGRLRLRWSFQEPVHRFKRDRNGEANQEGNNVDVEYGYIPWCGSSEASEETEASWKLLQRDIGRWIDKSLEVLKDDKLTQEIVEMLVSANDVGDNIKMDDSLDHDGEALMTLLKAKDDEAEKWEKNKEKRPKKLNQRVKQMKKLAQDGLSCWKRYFEGPKDATGESAGEEYLLSHQTNKDQDFATWQSIGLSDRRCLRFDPVKFDDWASEFIKNNGMSDIKASPSAKSLLQFAAEDLGRGLSWRIEGANGEVAAMLLGPHGSIWVKQEDRTIIEPFCVSDDDESYCCESIGNSPTVARIQPSYESIEEPAVASRQENPSDNESTEEPVAKKQKLTGRVTPIPTQASKTLQQQLLEKMEAMESTFKTEIANLKTSNADLRTSNTDLKAQLEGRIETVNSNLKQEMTGMKTTNENQALEIQILKADLHQTRLDLAKAQQQLANATRI